MTARPRFRSPLRSPWLTSHLGLWLGVGFAVCFVTGLLSHGIQHPPAWSVWPRRPVNLYRVAQGLHVATGLALVPLLGAKLWSVYPRLFQRPVVRGAAHALARASVALLVAGALFQVVSGVLNEARWYAAMPFFFTSAHHWVAWLTVGALLVHVAVQLPVVTAALAGGATAPDEPAVVAGSGLSRRGLLGAVAGAAGAITLATVGQTVRPLAGVSVLGPRDPRVGPQGRPVNRSARAAGVLASARDPGYRLRVVGPGGALSLSLADLAGLGQHDARLPIACVEGWSATAHWSGVRVRDLVALAGGRPGDRVLVESLQPAGRYRTCVLAPELAADPLTLLALRLSGEPLHLDHGYPCRLIAPDLPGVLQTKWVGRLAVGVPR